MSADHYSAVSDAVGAWNRHDDATKMRDLCASATAFKNGLRTLLEKLQPILHGGAEPTILDAVIALQSRGHERDAQLLSQILDDRPQETDEADVEWPAPCPKAAFHGLAGTFAQSLSPHTEADKVALLGSVLCAFGAAIGPNARAFAGDDEHPARLYFGLVGRTSKARKGSSWSPVRERMSKVDPAWAVKGIVSGLASGEGLIACVRDSKEGSNTESAKHVLCFEPELARVLQASKREGNTLSAVVRDAWDRTTLRVMTRGDPLHPRCQDSCRL